MTTKKGTKKWGEMVKLNLGCGDDIRKNCVNIDIQDLEGVDIVADVRGLPFGEGEVGEVIGQDLLEHFKNPIAILKEWYRILEVGGTVYIRVPNWEKIQDENFWRNTPFFRTENRVLGGRETRYDQHKSLFTKNILKKRMKKSGFKDITIKESKEPPLHWHLLAYGEK